METSDNGEPALGWYEGKNDLLRAKRSRTVAITLLAGLIMLLPTASTADARSRHHRYHHRRYSHHSAQRGRLTATRTKLRAARTRLAALRRTDAELMSTIHSVQGQLDSAKGLLNEAQGMLREIDARIKSQTRTLAKLEGERRSRTARLNKRVSTLYMMGPGIEADALLTAGNFSSFVERSSAFDFILRGDKLAMEDMARLTDRTGKARASLKKEAVSAGVWRARVSERVALVWDALNVHRAAEKALASRISDYQNEVRSLEAEQARIEGLINSRGSVSIGAVSIRGLQWPTISHSINSPYGPRWGGFHTGIDLHCSSYGDPIYAAKAGRVIAAQWGGGYGNMIIIDHGNGVSTLYAHQSKMYVSDGAQVTRGQHIGGCGSTGHSTGKHLHFEVRINGRHRNPLPYLP
ncbi:MAG: hypothetical protein NVSMB57_02490 [Actinomycetota bacterium]